MVSGFTRKDFLEALFTDYLQQQGGFIIVRTTRRLDHKVSTRFFPNIDNLTKEVYDHETNVFFGVCPREGTKGGEDSVRYLVALWAGLDLGSEGYSGRYTYLRGPAHAAKAVRSFAFPPSIVIESGYGVHLYWLLKTPVEIRDRGRIESVLQKLNAYFLCRTPIPLDSMLRLPDTTNCKMPGETSNCTVKYINMNFRYGIEQFEGLDLDFGGAIPESTTRWRPMEVEQEADAVLNDEALGAIDEVEYEDFVTTHGGEMALEEKPPSPGAAMKRPSATGEFPKAGKAGSYQTPTIGGADVIEVSTELAGRDLADEVAERVVARIKDTLADEIVDKLVERLRRIRGQ
ncbi:MAG: hypothetical protein AB1473_23225 [Thermodesulfobacteriota bacterium]